MKNQEIWDLQTPWRHRASFMFNLLSNLFCSFFLLLKVEVQKKERNKFDNKIDIKDARWAVSKVSIVYRQESILYPISFLNQ